MKEAEANAAQLKLIERRAELVRHSFLLVLISLAGTIVSCLLWGIGPCWKATEVAAVIIFSLRSDLPFGGPLEVHGYNSL